MSDAFPEICLELDTEPVCLALCFAHLQPLVTITGCPKYSLISSNILTRFKFILLNPHPHLQANSDCLKCFISFQDKF